MITINLTKAKAITHDARRAARAAIRTKYAEIQTAVNAATDVAALKTIMEQLA